MKTLAATALVLALAACSFGGSDGRSDDDAQSAAEAMQQTCAEVRAGIDAFNEQDYDGTVEHFEKALVPARTYAEVDDGSDAADLLDAVQYYAELAPEDYLDASRDSEDFARNKVITLTQCDSGDPIDGGESGTPV